MSQCLYKIINPISVGYSVSRPYITCEIVTSCISGRGHRIGAVCVCVCLSALSWLNRLTYQPWFFIWDLTLALARMGSQWGHSHKLGYAYAGAARVWFSLISVLEWVRFWKFVLIWEAARKKSGGRRWGLNFEGSWEPVTPHPPPMQRLIYCGRIVFHHHSLSTSTSHWLVQLHIIAAYTTNSDGPDVRLSTHIFSHIRTLPIFTD